MDHRKLINKVQKKTGLSYEEIGQEIGVSGRAIYSYMAEGINSRTPPKPVIINLQRILNTQ